MLVDQTSLLFPGIEIKVLNNLNYVNVLIYSYSVKVPVMCEYFCYAQNRSSESNTL